MAKSKAQSTAEHPNDAKWASVIADMHRLAATHREGGMAAVEKAFRVTRLPAVGIASQVIPQVSLDQLRRAVEALASFSNNPVSKHLDPLTAARVKSAEANPAVQRVAESGLAKNGLLVVGRKLPPALGIKLGAGGYAKAALQVPRGVGVVKYGPGKSGRPRNKSFTPFAECGDAVQASLAPHIEELISRLVTRLRSSHN